MSSQLLELKIKAALHYLELGFSVIPISRDKIPLIKWEVYQHQRPTAEEIKNWFTQFKGANVGIVTGAISGIVVVDVEVGGSVANLPLTVMSKTGGGGWHFFYKHPGKPIKTLGRIADRTDIRGDGGLVAAPPSVHKSGKQYEWVVTPELADFADLPQWVLEKSQDVEIKNMDWQKFIVAEQGEGSRNMTATQLAGKLLYHLPQEFWELTGWATMKEWNNSNNVPPLSEQELRTVWESIKKTEAGKRITGNSDSFQPLLFTELMAMEFADTEWLVEQLVPAGSTTVVSGAPAAYKTWLILDLAIKVAKGGILFDKFVANQAGVLIVDEESGKRLLQKRFQKLCKYSELPIHFLSLEGFRMEKKIIGRIISYAKEQNIKLIIFDSLVRIHASDENSATDMARVFNLLKQFNIEGLTVVFTHHNRKQGMFRSNPSQDMRGSSDILASVDCHLAVERKFKDDYLVLTQTKLRQGEEIKPFKLSVINDEQELRFEFAGEVDEVQTKKADMKEAIKDILEKEGRPMFGKELSEILRSTGVEGGYSTFKGALKEMLEKNMLFSQKGEKNKTFFSLTPSEPEAAEQAELPVG